jgi:type I restriction enzyme S subunit
MKAPGKPHKNDEWKSKYKEPVALDTSTLPQLPDGWCWAPLDALASVVGGVTKGQRRKPTEELRQVPYLRVANVQRGYLDLSVVKEIEATEDEINELRLKSGDVLFNEGGDRDKLGRGWVWNSEVPECIHQNHVFRARIYTQDLLPKFLSWYGNSSAQLFFLQEGKQTTNLASLNSTNLKKLPVPLPPLAEQKRIGAEIERALSVADASLNTIDASIARCNRLRQSILKWAFEGKLVDQDPNDEPVSVLLERIRAERAAAPSGKSRKSNTHVTEAAK